MGNTTAHDSADLAPPLLILRRRIVLEARSWLRTPFVAEACVKGVGVDCVQFGRGVGIGAGVLPTSFPDFMPYPSGWLLERDNTRYRDELAKYLTLVWEADCDAPFVEPAPGDLLLYRVGRAPAHSAICVGWPRVIHAWDEGGVVEVLADRNVLGPRSRPLCSIWRAQGRARG